MRALRIVTTDIAFDDGTCSVDVSMVAMLIYIMVIVPSTVYMKSVIQMMNHHQLDREEWRRSHLSGGFYHKKP